MENQRKIPKRIFSLFLAILCTFGILFVSYIDSFASYFFKLPKVSNSVSSLKTSGYVLCADDTTYIYIGEIVGANFLVGCYINGSNLYYYVYFLSNYSNQFVIYCSSSSSTFSHPSSPNVVTSSLRRSYVNSYPSSYLTNLDYFSSLSDLDVYMEVQFGFATPSPSPEPTSTPEPTPTPNPYGPGPVPTIPPGEQTYTDFFSRLASDAQSAFNAIFLSWNNANSRFYSGIFFIGFPILLGIIGLVASIFFGDDD